jgi:hypothetical protein
LDEENERDKGEGGDEKVKNLFPTSPTFPHSKHLPPPLIPNLLRQTILEVGAGLAADSNPEREWGESLHKAQT